MLNSRSVANCKAILTAIASIYRGLNAWESCLDCDPNTIPSLLCMTTPIPTLFSFANLGPSQLIFTNMWSSGFHFCTEEWAVWGDGGNLWSFSCSPSLLAVLVCPASLVPVVSNFLISLSIIESCERINHLGIYFRNVIEGINDRGNYFRILIER